MFEMIHIPSVNQYSLHLLSILFISFIKGFFVFSIAYFTIPRLKNLSSEYKHILWLLLIGSFILIPVMSMFTPILQFGTVKLLKVRGEIHKAFTSLLFPQFNCIAADTFPVPSGSQISKEAFPVSQNSNLHWSFWIVLIWFAGAFLFSLRIIIGKVALLYIITNIQTYKAKKYNAIAKQISEKLGISKEDRTADKCKM